MLVKVTEIGEKIIYYNDIVEIKDKPRFIQFKDIDGNIMCEYKKNIVNFDVRDA